MSDTILVTAANGTVGREVVEQLQAAGASFRIGLRDLRKSKVQGVVAVPFDFKHSRTFEAALDGVDKVFVLMPPAQPGIYSDVQNFIDAAKAADVSYVVYMSGMGVDRRPAEPMRHIERHIENSGLDYTFLQPNWFMENYNSWLAGMIEQGEIRLPLDDARISLIDTRDIAAVAVKLLTDETTRADYLGAACVLTGPEALDHHTIARMLTQVVGHEIQYVSTTVQQNIEELREQGLSKEELDTMRWLYEDVRSGYTATITSHVTDITGQQPRTFSAYIGEFSHLWARR